MADTNSIIEGIVKFRDGKKWKSRWCVMRKLSPVADCVHLQLYRDCKDRQKNGQTKSSLSLQQFLGTESGFTLDKQSNTLAILCADVVPVLAFDTRESLIQWRVKVNHNLGEDSQYPALLATSPPKSGLKAGPVMLHVSGSRICMTAGVPPKILRLWEVGHLRRYGIVEGRFCLEGGSRSGRGAGVHVFVMERGKELVSIVRQATDYDGNIGCRSLTSRAGSVFETSKFSMFDKSYLDQVTPYNYDICFHGSTRSVSPLWSPNKQTDTGPSNLDSSLPYDDPFGSDSHQGLLKRPSTLTRCSSCMGKVGGPLTRSSTMTSTPGGTSTILSPAWIMDSLTEKRSESDRASLYSRSSGSNSEYSVPRSVCLLDSKRSSPVTCCSTPVIPPKVCPCKTQLAVKTCSCTRRKIFTGPYENYDVPKTPMPLIKEHPCDMSSPAKNYYDTPKRLRQCIEHSCKCSRQETVSQTPPPNSDYVNEGSSIEFCSSRNSTAADSSSNYVNIDPSQLETEPSPPFTNYANVELSETLEKFESSSQILRSAGFSQEEIDSLDDSLDDRKQQMQINGVSGVYNQSYMNMEPVKFTAMPGSNLSDKDIDMDISQKSFETNLLKRKSTSAEFIKKIEESLDFSKSNSHKDISLSSNILRKVTKNECVNDRCIHCISGMQPVDEYVTVFKVPERINKNENSLVAKFKESVKIRRSSSVPSKSEKNRDSSSSNDSGVSTGSLKHHKCDFSDFELPITNSKSCKKNVCNIKKYKTIDTWHSDFVKSNSSDPLRNITFQFDEATFITKANSCEADTLTRNRGHHRQDPAGFDGSNHRNSQAPSQSSSGASDMSDYIETLSISSFSSYDVSDVKQNTASLRPRSGKEYHSIDRARLASACNPSD